MDRLEAMSIFLTVVRLAVCPQPRAASMRPLPR